MIYIIDNDDGHTDSVTSLLYVVVWEVREMSDDRPSIWESTKKPCIAFLHNFNHLSFILNGKTVTFLPRGGRCLCERLAQVAWEAASRQEVDSSGAGN